MRKIVSIRFFVLLTCSLVCTPFLCAQNTTEPYMRWITEDDGLPSDEVYHVMQDNKGFLWMATDNGIVKYDGKTMEVFNKSNGLPENVVFRLYKKEAGKIIGECISNKYFTLQNDHITPFKINDSISKHLGSANISFSYEQDIQGNHHFGTRYGLFSFNNKGNILSSPEVQNPFSSQDSLIKNLLLFHVDNTWLAAKQALNKKQSELNKNFCLKFVNSGRSFLYHLPETFIGSFIGNSVHVVEIDKGKICLNYGKVIFLIGKNGITNQMYFSSPTLDLYYYGGNIFVCTQSHGVYQIKIKGNELVQVGHFLDGFSVTSGIRSTDGSYWFSTREKGVAQILDLKLNIEGRVIDDNISAVLLDSGLKIIGTEKGIVYKNNRLIHKLPNSITDFLNWTDGSIIALSTPNTPIGFQSQKGRLDWLNFNEQNKYFHLRNGLIFNHYLVGLGTSSYLIYDLKFKKINRKIIWGGQKREKIFATLNLREEIYIAAGNGLYKINLDKNLYHKQLISNEVNFIQKFKDGILVFSQSGEAYFVKGDKVHKVALPKFHMINRYYSFFVDGNLLLAANNLGVYKWEINSRMEFILRDFKPMPRVNIIGSHGNYWYYATKKLVITEKKNIIESVKPALLMKSIILNGKVIQREKSNSFDYQSNNFQFNFQTIDYKSKFVYYKYKLDNHDKEYLYGTMNSVNYSALNPGTYTFRVSVTTDGFRYSDEIKFTFIIHPPFWKTTWFILFSSLGILVLIISIVFNRIKRYRESHRIEKLMITLRSQALTTQLNPHLIFNILNSIQGMVSEGEIENVNSYIAQFSKFMRRTLNMSKQEFVSLSEEIENTIQYTELEKLRFLDSIKFEFSIEVMDNNFQVPPMIIQPLIENAIKHGVMPKLDNHGEIKIIIRENEKSLLIQVEDNGVGFMTDNILNGDGLRITSERISAISTMNEIKVINQVNPTIVQITYTK